MHQSAIKQHRLLKGFTLIEMLTVLAVIGFLVAITIGVTRSVEERGRISRAETQLAALSQALEQYKAHYGDYPWVLQSLDPVPSPGRHSLYRALNGYQGPQGHDLSTDPQRVFLEHGHFRLLDADDPDVQGNHLLDPWGKPYRYFYKVASSPGVTNGTWSKPTYVLYSMGPSEQGEDPDSQGEMDYDHGSNRDNIYANR